MSHAHCVNREQTEEREEKIDYTASKDFLKAFIYTSINMEKTAALKTVLIISPCTHCLFAELHY